MKKIDVKKMKLEILNLNTQIENVINGIENAQGNIFEHIRKKALESKSNRLIEIDKIFGIEKYKIVFIGTIGAGKTTAICHLFNLIGDFNKEIERGGKKRVIKSTESLLSTGSGRTTLSEVLISPSDETYLQIEPYTKEELEKIIIGFCESFYKAKEEGGQIVSVEIERAIRSITKLNRTTKKIKGKNNEETSKTIDLALEKSKTLNEEEFKAFALKNANLDKRVYTKDESKIIFEKGDFKIWLKENFEKINKAQITDFSLPKKIFANINSKYVENSKSFEAIIDTKGIDENPIIPELINYIEQEDAICLFTSNYCAAPEANIHELMVYFLTKSSRNYEDRFVVFVMPHKGEPENENDSDKTWETGVDLKKNIITNVFKNLNLKFKSENVIFYDAFRYYDSEGRLDRDYENEPEIVQNTNNEVINSLLNIIENRKEKLLSEINDINESFQQLQEGKTLTEKEILSLNSIINNIKQLTEINTRIPSFVYEEFIDNYIAFYAEHYKAWNTKDAIHRRLGTFEERGYDTYSDAKVVAEGKDENKMLRKFTKVLKTNIINELNNLGNINNDLKTFVPEIMGDFNRMYDNFIKDTGEEIEIFLRTNNENETFWREAIERRGKGSGYNIDVCTILKRKLEIISTGLSANRILQEYTEKNWKLMIKELLNFFAEN